MAQNNKQCTIKDLRKRVLTLELSPGMQLDEVALAEHYGLSRTPLREILQRLSGEGYLSIEVNRGSAVTSMDMGTMRNFFQSAPMIYAAIARLATEQATPSSINELKKIQRQFQRSVKSRNAAQMSLHNHQFHAQLGVMANSVYLGPSLERLLIDHTRMSHRFYQTGEHSSFNRVDEACAQHDLMIEAIANKDPASVVEQTLAHWDLSRDEIDKYVLPDALPFDAINENNAAGVI